MNPLTWFGILFCLSQSALFSGSDLAAFAVGRLRLEVDAAGGDPAAKRVCEIREKLIAYIQRHHPQSLPRFRAQLGGDHTDWSNIEPAGKCRVE